MTRMSPEYGDLSDPAIRSHKVSESRFKSLAYALAGCWYMLRTQKNMRIIALATAGVALLAAWLRPSPVECALLALATGMVWLAEFINGAIEAAVDLASQGAHPVAKTAKDVAAGAALVASVAAAMAGLLILGPPLAQKLVLNGGF